MPTKIEWTDETWNPVTGCDPVSAGCDNCYARRMANNRLRGRCGYPQDNPFKVTLHPDRLDQPLHWRKPRMVFVCSMGDLFHKDVNLLMLDKIWQVMLKCSQHTFIILTKRPKRILGLALPPRDNIWLGVSVESQKTADLRIPELLKVQAAVRIVSYEPALGAISLTSKHEHKLDQFEKKHHLRLKRFNLINWVICGGETGPGARPMNPAWARGVRDQCVAAGVPYFHKQNGMWTGRHSVDISNFESVPVYPFERIGNHKHILVAEHTEDQFNAGGLLAMTRVTKKQAGRTLDGRTWNEIPEVSRD